MSSVKQGASDKVWAVYYLQDYPNEIFITLKRIKFFEIDVCLSLYPKAVKLNITGY